LDFSKDDEDEDLSLRLNGGEGRGLKGLKHLVTSLINKLLRARRHNWCPFGILLENWQFLNG